MIWPLPKDKYPITSGYGPREYWYNNQLVRDFHSGVDQGAPEGTRIVATADGIVSFAGISAGDYGAFKVTIEHKATLRTLFLHMRSVSVKAGQHIKAGDIIGEVGRTGKVTGPHLHTQIELFTNGNWQHVNPIPYLDNTVPQEESALAPNEYRVKYGGWISNVVQELIDSGIWVKENNEQTWNYFYSLNQPTPQGGYKAGDIIKTGIIEEKPAPISVLQAPVPQPVSTNIDPVASPVVEPIKPQSEPVVINIPSEIPKPENPTPPEVVEMAKNPAINFDVKNVTIEPWQKDLIIEQAKPLLTKFGAWWKKLPRAVTYTVGILISILLPSLIDYLGGINPSDILFNIGGYEVTITQSTVAIVLSLFMALMTYLKKKDDEYLVENYVRPSQ